MSLILVVFFLKGLFLATLSPMFSGQDESRHYNTIQFLAEPKEKNWEIIKIKVKNREKERLETYNFSEEIKKTIVAAQLNIERQGNYSKALFSGGYNGKNEAEINSDQWDPYNKEYPPDIAGKRTKAYHLAALQIEKLFGQQSILIRFYLIRIFSILLATAVVLISYLVFKNSGFSKKISLAITAIIAFQPKFSDYMSNINYDSLLILSFALFTLGAVLFLKNGFNWKNLALMSGSVVLGLLTKGPAIALLIVFLLLISFHIYQGVRNKKISKKYILFFITLVIALLFVFGQKYNLAQIVPWGPKDSPTEIISSASEYLSKSITRIPSSSTNYWGNLDWTHDNIDKYIIWIIWAAEFLAVIGLVLFFRSDKKPSWLPEKKYIIFFLIMIIVLQFGIRLADWSAFIKTGSLKLGTPGRYFLPNIIAHMTVVFTGLGIILKKEKYFRNILIGGLILMFSFSMYLIFDIIMPRFYL